MSKRFNIMTVFTSLLLIFCISATVHADDLLPPPPENHFEPPKIELISDRVVSFTPGEAREIDVRIKNIGDRGASDIWVRASADANAPISFELGRNSERFGMLVRNAERDIRLNVRVSSAAASESYPINLKFTYRNQNNQMVEDDIVVYIKVEGEDTSPKLILSDFSVSSDRISAGDDFTITAVLRNVGTADARNIRVELADGLVASEIFLSGMSNNQFLGSLRAGETQNISFSLGTHRDNTRDKSYALTFKVRYSDTDNKVQDDETFNYFVNVRGSASSNERANLEIIQMSVPTGTYNVAQEFAVQFELMNKGVEAAKNIKVTATSDGTAIVPRSADTRSLVQLQPGMTSNFTFTFMPTSDSKTRNYTISFKVEYENGLETDNKPEIDTFEQFIGVNVYNPDEEDDDDDDRIRIPKIIIDSYTVNPLIVSAGQEFDISMVFRNTHPSTSIENVKVVLTPLEPTENSSSPFMPVDGSNTFYISHIPPGGTANKDFRMYAIPNADPRAYTIRVDFDYQDGDYNEYQANEIIGVTVKQTTKLDTGNIMMPTEGFMFQPFFVNINLMNTGKSTLNNLTVEIKGDGFDVSRSFMYFGTLNRGNVSYYDAEITPMMPGPQEGIILISYEDDSGDVTVIERDFVMNVMDMPMHDDFGHDYMMDFPPDRGMGMGGGSPLDWLKNPFVWVGVVALGVAAFFGKKFYNKKRRPKFDE